MKKLYITPLIAFEPLEEEELLIAGSHTETTTFVIDPKEDDTDEPGFAGGGNLGNDDGLGNE